MTPPRIVDAAAAATSIGVVVLVLVGEQVWFRPAVALIFVLFVPGWVMLRLAQVPITSLAVLGAFVLSVVAMTATSFALVTRLGWNWRPAAVIWAVLCADALIWVLSRDRSSDRVDDAVSDPVDDTMSDASSELVESS